MKTTIDFEEKDEVFHIGIRKCGLPSKKERRLIRILVEALPKTAPINIVPLRNLERFGNQDEALAAFTEEVGTLRLSPSAIRFVEWLWARAKKNEG